MVLQGLAAEARKYRAFDDFLRAFAQEIRHGQYWHVTDDPKFRIRPESGPRDMSSLALGGARAGKLMVTSDLEHWASHYAGSRGFAAEIDLSALQPNEYWQVGRGFGNEFFVNAPEKARVVGVYPIRYALQRSRRYRARLPRSEEELRRLWNSVHGTREEARRFYLLGRDP